MGYTIMYTTVSVYRPKCHSAIRAGAVTNETFTKAYVRCSAGFWTKDGCVVVCGRCFQAIWCILT